MVIEMTKICLVRHGETDYNKKTLIQGLIDNPLNERGMLQAMETGKWFEENDNDFDIIISSPLVRAMETAKIIASCINYDNKIIAEPRFVERNFGKLEGQLVNEDFYNILYNDFSYEFEKNEDICSRTMSALSEIVKKFDGKKILIVCHSHVIKSIICSIDSTYDFRFTLVNCGINYITYDNGYSISKINIST